MAVYSAIKAEVVEHDAAPTKVPSTLKVDIGFEMDMAETWSGMDPQKELYCVCHDVSAVSSPSSVGRVLENIFELIFKIFNEVSNPTSVTNDPVNEFDNTGKEIKAVIRPI